MKVYIDKNFKCHATNTDGVFREVETDFFNGKCNAYIEGYRFVPAGEIWMREDGTVFRGEMVAPWKDYAELDSAQREYELQQLAQYEAALAETEAAEAAYREGVQEA